MNKMSLIILLLSTILLGACNQNTKDKYAEDSQKHQYATSQEIKELKSLLKDGENKEFITRLAVLKDSNNKEVTILSKEFINSLIQEKNIKFLNEEQDFIQKEQTLFDEKTRKKVKRIISKEKAKLLDEMALNINNNNYAKVKELYENILLVSNQEALALYEYGNYLEKGERSYNASYNLAINVNPLYKGRLKNEITEAITDKSYLGTSIYDPMDKNEWEANYNTIKLSRKNTEIANKEEEPVDLNTPSEPYPPQIGMTDYEVLNESTWGKPKRINTTVTVDGKREQWVYSYDKYLYFEDGYLVSMQY
ncbi:hypothetical protein M3603_15640 [Rummeliibacillus stabekisii]|uniref:hypothetical protein n=1 Tax=Rummeliibacillus stabekisii TaxID=241244 RepID=UPI00203A95E1|nr:hypothetical protein [Rummeliibacillus stabekisii]MCM3318050.1 hypothetical protein [Rummeliibacillus stabekisii]